MKRWFLFLFVVALLACGLPAPADVLLRGDIDYVTSRSRVHLFVEDITNFGSETTDRLRLRMWASKDHWRADRPGRLVAFSLLPRLLPGEDRENIVLSRPFRRPSSGWYYVTLTLEERTLDENGQVRWVIQDLVLFDQEYFSSFDPFPFD